MALKKVLLVVLATLVNPSGAVKAKKEIMRRESFKTNTSTGVDTPSADMESDGEMIKHDGAIGVGGGSEADPYTINPSTGACPTADWLSETQCAALNGQVIDGKVVDYKGSGTWGSQTNPEACGCYFNSGAGDVYFNLKTVGCNGADPDEISICLIQKAVGWNQYATEFECNEADTTHGGITGTLVECKAHCASHEFMDFKARDDPTADAHYCICSDTCTKVGYAAYDIYKRKVYEKVGMGVCSWHYEFMGDIGAPACANLCQQDPDCQIFTYGGGYGCRYSKCGADPGPSACPTDLQCVIGATSSYTDSTKYRLTGGKTFTECMAEKDCFEKHGVATTGWVKDCLLCDPSILKSDSCKEYRTCVRRNRASLADESVLLLKNIDIVSGQSSASQVSVLQVEKSSSKVDVGQTPCTTPSDDEYVRLLKADCGCLQEFHQVCDSNTHQPTCLKKLACKNANVCAPWKTSNCQGLPTSLIEKRAQVNTSRHAATLARIDAFKGLDNTLSFKRTC